MPAHRSRSNSAHGAITSTATAASFSSNSTSSSSSNSDSSNNTGAHKPRLFQCTGYGDCRMVFTRSEHLARHARKHTGEKPFQCIMPDCNKMFSRFDNMMQHTQTHRNHQQHHLQQQQQQPMLRRRRRSSTSSTSSSSSDNTSVSSVSSVATLSDHDPVTTTTTTTATANNSNNNNKANITTKREQPRRLSIADLCNPLINEGGGHRSSIICTTRTQPSSLSFPATKQKQPIMLDDGDDTKSKKSNNRPMLLLTPDEMEALQAFGRLQRATTPDLYDSLRELVSDRQQQQCPCL
ncbi:hypothetical protein BDB00DRAFT_803187 [Zychaea mexicana]|uniref:uncharacterized protein n=1 Tax=Zychaea mexicana TaxID=64656 RepID=UPI0022FEA663|nr:uncharacterized protein BDB00DRAFT_803187 [Zychaea mexicana]KAI9497569.1 hypothetical protein BDB00DRAFT_803187 [Zychaea mexicana]